MYTIIDWLMDHALLPALIGGILGVVAGAPLLSVLDRRKRREIIRLREQLHAKTAMFKAEKELCDYYRDMLKTAFDIYRIDSYTVDKMREVKQSFAEYRRSNRRDS